MIGTTLDGKYEIVRAIGTGGMGAVYEAVHLGTSRRVAVKVILAANLTNRSEQIARFQREARLAGGIETRHICQVLDTGTDPGGNPYMVMELMRGKDAAEHLKELGPLSAKAALAVVLQACRGLQRAHEAGIVHRDVKPANLFLCEEEDGEITVKLLDFGIAKMRGDAVPTEGSDPTLTRTGALMGSPLYMSPEQARGKDDIDARSDLYSLGVVLYRLLSGRAPYQHIDAFGDLIMSICTGEVPSIQEHAPWTEPHVAELVHRALRTRREARYQTAAEMLTAIEAALGQGFRLRKEHLAPIDEATRKVVAPALPDLQDERARSATQNAVSTTRTDGEPPARSGGSSKAGMFLGVAVGFVAAATASLYVMAKRTEPGPQEPAAALATTSPLAAPEASGAELAREAPSAAPSASSSTTTTTSPGDAASSATASASAAPAPVATGAAPLAPTPPRPVGTLPRPAVPPVDEFGGRK